VQFGLFSAQLPESAQLDVTLARIRAIVGEGNVGQTVLTDSYRPQGFRVKPFRLSSSSTSDASSNTSRSAVRKLRLVENTSLTIRDNRPSDICFSRKALHSQGSVWTLADKRRLVESVRMEFRTLGLGSACTGGRRTALLLRDACRLATSLENAAFMTERYVELHTASAFSFLEAAGTAD
jgi:hypothetical protein